MSADPDCIFCKIAAGDVPANVVYQDDHVVAFRDLNPVMPVHVLVVPNQHVANTEELGQEHDAMVGRLVRTAQEVARREGVAQSGYRLVINTGADTELIEAIRTVHRGEVFLYPAATKLLVDGYLDRSARDEDPFDGLTEREREVLKLVAEGYSGTEIAEQLVISPKTVDTYRERIMQKLGVRHRYELVRYALRKGMLKADLEQA